MEVNLDKKIVGRTVILALFIGYFGSSVFWGKTGLLRYFKMKKEIELDKEKLIKLKNKIDKINTKIALWQQSDFELEKMAREKLYMGFPDEKVYLLK